MPSSSFPVGKNVGAISCTTMTLFTKCYTPLLGTRINNTIPALKTTTVNRPVPALKKKGPSRREQKIQPPGPGAEKTQPPRPVPPSKKYNRPVTPRKEITTAPSRLGKKIQPPRPASGKKNDRPVPPRKKKKNRPVPPRKKKTTVPSRQEFCLEKYRPVPSRPVPPRISTPIFCQSRAPAEIKKVGQPSIFPPSRPVEILAVNVKPCKIHSTQHPRSPYKLIYFFRSVLKVDKHNSILRTTIHPEAIFCEVLECAQIVL